MILVVRFFVTSWKIFYCGWKIGRGISRSLVYLSAFIVFTVRELRRFYPDTNGVGRRTIEKDIFYLEYEGPFLVEIERYSAPGYNSEKQKSYNKRCLRYTSSSFSIFKKDLSDDEEYLLKEALSLLGQFEGLPNLDALEGLRLGLGVRKNERKIISLTKNPLENSNLLGELFTTISHRQVVELY